MGLQSIFIVLIIIRRRYANDVRAAEQAINHAYRDIRANLSVRFVARQHDGECEPERDGARDYESCAGSFVHLDGGMWDVYKYGIVCAS